MFIRRIDVQLLCLVIELGHYTRITRILFLFISRLFFVFASIRGIASLLILEDCFSLSYTFSSVLIARLIELSCSSFLLLILFKLCAVGVLLSSGPVGIEIHRTLLREPLELGKSLGLLLL